MNRKITPQERRLAIQRQLELERCIRKSLLAAERVGFRLQRHFLAAYKKNTALNPREIVLQELLKGRDELRDAMVVAHLLGLKSWKSEPQPLSFSTEAEKAIKVLRKMTNLPQEKVEQLRQMYDAEAFRVLSNAGYAIETRLLRKMEKITSEGLHVKDGVKELRKTFDRLGITPTSNFQLEAIYRTQTQTAYHAAKWLQGQELGDFLWGYKYTTVGDDRVRPEHLAMEGTTLPKDHPFWRTSFPPNGWACRCTVIELFEERDVLEPPKRFETTDEYGEPITVEPVPDRGFAYNPGMVLAM